MDVPQHWVAAKQYGLCFRCLGDDHRGQSCTRSSTCDVNSCPMLHNRLLHQDNNLKPSSVTKVRNEQPYRQQGQSYSSNMDTSATKGEPRERSHNTTMVAEAKSRHEHVTLRTVPVILRNSHRSIRVNALLDDASTKTYLNSDVAAELDLQGQVERVSISVINGQTESFETMPVEFELDSINGQVRSKITAFTTSQVTGNLQAIDYNRHSHKWNHLKGIRFPVQGHKPTIDLLIGIDHMDLHYLYRDIRGQPEVLGDGIFGSYDNAKALTIDNKAALEMASSSSLQHSDNRYRISILWVDGAPTLQPNYKMALQLLENTEKLLLRTPEVGSAYTETISRYIERGYVRKVTQAEQKPANMWYIPHFAVKKPVALVCDISEMYLQIEISQKDQPFHRFLWRDLCQDKSPNDYEFNRIVFGIKSLPFLAQFVAQQHANSNRKKYPVAADPILKSTYMDDRIDSVMTEKQGIELYHQLSGLWAGAGMNAHKWLSNSVAVLDEIPVENRASELDLDNELPSVKTLGVMWQAVEDMLGFCFSSVDDKFQYTKKNFLKKIASLFDPRGFLWPFTICAKILLQEMWASGVDWDDMLSDSLTTKARTWFMELDKIAGIQVPRCLQMKVEAEVTESKLHTFVDASQDAYGAVVYYRTVYSNGQISSRIVASETRVAPLKATSIPRLEMMAAVLGLRLTESVTAALEMSMKTVIFWSDSMNVLWWIRSQSKNLKPFITNRAGKIQNLTTPEQWRYVPTQQNHADQASRGASVGKLLTEDMWWTGSDFLLTGKQEWPQNHVEKGAHVNDKAKRCKADETHVSLMSVQKLDGTNLNLLRYSSWIRLVRVTAWVNRFIDNCRANIADRKSGGLTPAETIDAEIAVIKTAQQHDEYRDLVRGRELVTSSKLLPLNLCIDEDMGCWGVMADNFVSHDVRFPVIIPRKNQVTKLIVKYHHEKRQHGGTNQVLADLSSRYWVIPGREEIREWEKECNVCRRRKAKVCSQIMASLPGIRLRTPLHVFARIAVDFGGPYITKQGHGKSRLKRYLCLFTWLASRAVQ